MRAVKGNKEYTIDDTQKKAYQDRGFDILDETGTTIAYGRGKPCRIVNILRYRKRMRN